MYGERETLPYRLRFLIVGALVIANLFLLSLLLPGAQAGSKTKSAAQHTTHTNSDAAIGVYDSPNAVTNALAMGRDEIASNLGSTAQVMGSNLRTIGDTVAGGGEFIVSGTFHATGAVVHGIGTGLAFTGRGISIGFAFTARGIGNTALFLIRFPGSILGSVSKTAPVGAIMNEPDHTAVPTIDPQSPEVLAAQAKLSAMQPVSQVTSSTKVPAKTVTVPSVAPRWPLHGAITTLFGVPELPYEAIHTGLDISDGTRPGTTPVYPFKPGKVIEVIHSAYGLGNHVTIVHGAGVTSVYGHLNSISVVEGQQVDESTIVGYEGTTGASTGTHLHFEIRVNGKATDPHGFIPGEPYN